MVTWWSGLRQARGVRFRASVSDEKSRPADCYVLHDQVPDHSPNTMAEVGAFQMCAWKDMRVSGLIASLGQHDQCLY